MKKEKVKFTWMPTFNEKWNELIKETKPPNRYIELLKAIAEMFFGHGYYAGQDEMLARWEDAVAEHEREWEKLKEMEKVTAKIAELQAEKRTGDDFGM